MVCVGLAHHHASERVFPTDSWSSRLYPWFGCPQLGVLIGRSALWSPLSRSIRSSTANTRSRPNKFGQLALDPRDRTPREEPLTQCGELAEAREARDPLCSEVG